MSEADKIITRVLAQPAYREASAVIIGTRELETLKDNPDPSSPPQFQYRDNRGYTLCGLPVITSHSGRKLAFVIDIP